MSRSSFPGLLFLAAIAIFAGVSFCESSVSAQDAETAKITTADGVKLHAVFYAAKKNSPTVIMLHPIGEGKSSKPQDWKNLAQALQKANYSVLMFDFRGHGESTTIDDKDLFWNKKINIAHVKSKDKEVIDVKDYIKSVGGAYLPVLVNDIAAVRAYLDRRDDCNTSNLIVLGAESGATLGAVWMNAEWHRYKYSPPPMFTGFNLKFLDTRQEGKDIVAAVFLGIQPTLEKRPVSVTSLLKVACKDNATSAVFICGKGDQKASDFAKKLETSLKVKNSKKHADIFASELETNLAGIKLLQKSLGTDKKIVEHLDGVVAEKKNDRVERDFLNTFYMWKAPPAMQLVPAKNRKGEKNLNFDDYNKFTP